MNVEPLLFEQNRLDNEELDQLEALMDSVFDDLRAYIAAIRDQFEAALELPPDGVP
jgi:hypothetical protein